MFQGLSLHIGLNYVDPNAYDGWDGALAGCINDATDLRDLAVNRGFSPTLMIDEDATSGSVVSAISDAADRLKSGDHFLLTYSGHGGQIPDESGEETDGLDETWVLWDRQLLDNELYALWNRFEPGVKILMLSDSCHSGTVIKSQEMRQLFSNLALSKGVRRNSPAVLTASTEVIDARKAYYTKGDGTFASTPARSVPAPALRFMELQASVDNYLDNRSLYRSIKALAGHRNPNDVRASLLFISGCQDNQFSYDGDDNGYFTGKVLETWNGGAFQGSHREFFEAVLAQMPPHQTPEYSTLGPRNEPFSASLPFTIMTQTGAVIGGNGSPDVNTPVGVPRLDIAASWNVIDGPARFSVSTGAHPYYYVEFATEAALFDYESNGPRRTADNFYASWADTSLASRLTGGSYTMPTAVWMRLKSAVRLFYRIGSTPKPVGWEGVHLAFPDSAYSQAPSFTVTSGSAPAGPDPVPDNGAGNNGCDLIGGEIGAGRQNTPFDVKLVQALLNEIPRNAGGPQRKLTVDGKYGTQSHEAIGRFQTFHGITEETSGSMRPGGETLRQLRQQFGVTS